MRLMLVLAVVLCFAGATYVSRAATPAGSCRSVTTFVSSAVPAMQKDRCVSCHAGASAAATRALDLTNVGKDNTAACGQVIQKVNMSNKPQSVIIQAPAGKIAHMGGKVSDGPAFTTALLGWIDNE